MKNEANPAPERIERLVCNRAQARELLGGISESTMWRLEQRGLIQSIPHFRHKIYSLDALRRFVNGTAR